MGNRARMASDRIKSMTFRQWSAITGIVLFLFISSLLVSGAQVKAAKGQLNEWEAVKRKAANELSLKKNSAKQVETKFKRSATGLDDIRAGDDQKIARRYFEPAFTWSSGEEYDKARKGYLKDMGDDSVFLSVFMPPNGTIDDYNYVDVNHLNSEMKTFAPYVINIQGNDYTYMAFIETSSEGTASSGKGAVMAGMGTGKAIVQYTMKDGRISDVNAWTLQE